MLARSRSSVPHGHVQGACWVIKALMYAISSIQLEKNSNNKHLKLVAVLIAFD